MSRTRHALRASAADTFGYGPGTKLHSDSSMSDLDRIGALRMGCLREALEASILTTPRF
jgi:hypothetical protein